MNYISTFLGSPSQVAANEKQRVKYQIENFQLVDFTPSDQNLASRVRYWNTSIAGGLFSDNIVRTFDHSKLVEITSKLVIRNCLVSSTLLEFMEHLEID